MQQEAEEMFATECHVLFDLIENTLATAVSAFQLAPMVKAGLDKTTVTQLQKEQQIWQQTCQDIETKLTLLDEIGALETSGLHLNFRPLLQHLRYLDDILATCRVFQELEHYLMQEMAEVKDASIALTKQIFPYHLPKFETGLEQFMDRCDQVADQLDALEYQGHDIKPLTSLYEKWVALVEQFGDILDERTDALVTTPALENAAI